MDYLPRDIEDGLAAGRRDPAVPARRMQVQVGGQRFTLLRYSERGFAVDTADAPRLRGQVDLYEGARHLARCLIVATGETAGETDFEIKQAAWAMDRAPRDFAPDDTGSQPARGS